MQDTTSTIYTDLFIPETNNFSFCCWYKAETSTSGYVLGLSRAKEPSLMLFKDGTTRFRLYLNSYSTYTHNLDITEWHHYTITYDSNKAILYIDGQSQLEREQTVDFTSNEYRLFLAARSNSNNTIGNISNHCGPCYYNDIRYYNHCLSAAEVREISQGLVLHYKLDDITNGIQDSSGYGNNGIINSNPTISLETRRYNYSISFDGVDDCIKIPFNDIIKDKNYTVSVWTYKTSIGTKNYQTILGGPSGFELEARSSSSTSPLYRIHNWGGGTTAYEFNKWNLFTFVHTDSNSKLYVNGELKITGTSANIPTGNYYIGAWNSVTGQNYEGLMSDFRIYCTALDADAIRQLYELGAKVDNKQNLHAFELVENNSKIQITKQGQVKCNELEEDEQTKFYQIDQIIETNEIIEL